jgi:glycerol-3-phosphate acyltransferase PlsY
MSSFLPLIFSILAYLLGSIPTSVWVGKLFFNTDIRNHGSGNAGANNALRVLGWKAGLIVAVIDVSKAIAAVSLINLIPWIAKGSELYFSLQAVFGLCAILGHIFPVFAGFRGGKGVATVFGAMLVINFPATVISFGVFLIAILLTRYVSLGSILAGLAFPVCLILIFKISCFLVVIFSLIVPLLIILTHNRNIGRLLRGDERKFSFRNRENSIEIIG